MCHRFKYLSDFTFPFYSVMSFWCRDPSVLIGFVVLWHGTVDSSSHYSLAGMLKLTHLLRGKGKFSRRSKGLPSDSVTRNNRSQPLWGQVMGSQQVMITYSHLPRKWEQKNIVTSLLKMFTTHETARSFQAVPSFSCLASEAHKENKIKNRAVFWKVNYSFRCKASNVPACIVFGL